MAGYSYFNYDQMTLLEVEVHIPFRDRGTPKRNFPTWGWRPRHSVSVKRKRNVARIQKLAGYTV